MPRSVVDFSSVSDIIRAEPFHLHFWESTPREALAFLQDPRAALLQLGLRLPKSCRIETTIENHDWLSDHSNRMTQNNGTIICGTGGGNIAKNYYKVSFYAHRKSDVGKYKKALLHPRGTTERKAKR